MSNSKKPIYTKVRTPKGVFGYVWLSKPDTKWKAEGEYKVDLTFDGDSEDAAAFIAKVEHEMQASRKLSEERLDASIESATGAKKGEAKKRRQNLGLAASPIKEVLDEEGESTGSLKITAKLPAKVTRKSDGKVFALTPAVVDGVGNKLPHNALRIGAGSEGKLFVELRPYYNAKDNVAGVTVRLVTVRVLKLVEYGSGGATGFEDDDDVGEDLSDRVQDEPSSNDTPGNDDDDDPDFA